MEPRGWFVEVVCVDGDEVVRRLGPFTSERQADKCERGLEINLNHEKYFVRVVGPES